MRTQYRYKDDILVLSLLENTLYVENAPYVKKLILGQFEENPAMVVDLGELRELDSFASKYLRSLPKSALLFAGSGAHLKSSLITSMPVIYSLQPKEHSIKAHWRNLMIQRPKCVPYYLNVVSYNRFFFGQNHTLPLAGHHT